MKNITIILGSALLLSACQGVDMPSALSTTIFNRLSYTPLETGTMNVRTIIKDRDRFMVDHNGEEITVYGANLKSLYNNKTQQVVAHIGMLDLIKSEDKNLVNAMGRNSGSFGRQMLLAQGGMKCFLTKKSDQKRALKEIYGGKMTVTGTVSGLKGGWMGLKNCSLSDGRRPSSFYNPKTLDFIEGKWCGMPSKFGQVAPQWQVRYRKTGDNSFSAKYIYATEFSKGWQDKGVETFSQSGKELKQSITNPDGSDSDGGLLVIRSKESMHYYQNGKSQGVKPVSMRKCK